MNQLLGSRYMAIVIYVSLVQGNTHIEVSVELDILVMSD